jgi:hypothetical protein
MWNCNGSASPACPERRVLPIVTPWAATDERGTTFSGLVLGGCEEQSLEARGRSLDDEELDRVPRAPAIWATWSDANGEQAIHPPIGPEPQATARVPAETLSSGPRDSEDGAPRSRVTPPGERLDRLRGAPEVTAGPSCRWYVRIRYRCEVAPRAATSLPPRAGAVGSIDCGDGPFQIIGHIAQIGPARGAWFCDPDGRTLAVR